MSFEEDEAEYVRYLEREIGKRELEISALKLKIAEVGRENSLLREELGDNSTH